MKSHFAITEIEHAMENLSGVHTHTDYMWPPSKEFYARTSHNKSMPTNFCLFAFFELLRSFDILKTKERLPTICYLSATYPYTIQYIVRTSPPFRSISRYLYNFRSCWQMIISHHLRYNNMEIFFRIAFAHTRRRLLSAYSNQPVMELNIHDISCLPLTRVERTKANESNKKTRLRTMPLGTDEVKWNTNMVW